jgi:ApaG protein
MFEATTKNICIEVEPTYVREQSDPGQGRYFFSYRVRIRNEGAVRVQLLSRHWIITDGFGQIEEVVGEGVIGQQPTLQPGEHFEYESFCPLATPTGSMQGTYTMTDSSGEKWEVKIPLFILAEPSRYH